MANKAPKRASLDKSPFSEEQVSWIILKFGELKNFMAEGLLHPLLQAQPQAGPQLQCLQEDN